MSKHRFTFSLGSMFLLIACIAIMSAATRSAAMHWKDDGVATAWIAAGSIIGSIIGLCVGVGSRSWIRGGFWGFLAGTVSGGMAGAQLSAPPDLLIICTGVLILLALSITLRRQSVNENNVSLEAEVNVSTPSMKQRDSTLG